MKRTNDSVLPDGVGRLGSSSFEDYFSLYRVNCHLVHPYDLSGLGEADIKSFWKKSWSVIPLIRFSSAVTC